MKLIIKITLTIFFIFLTSCFVSCSEDSPIKTTNEDIVFTANQIPGCNGSFTLDKVSVSGSCFSYTFDDTLKIDFCVPGNCCPDSDRFVTNYDIKSDTLFVTVADTAENLCYCICNYVIHIEVTGLPNERYVFRCDYENLEYNEVVSKTN